ncbi:MAG: IS200/IS605 family transposase [Patescibacteria group bacterium]|nr:IS200/IS605 family transposase [Patescibacteria group bacterium]
MTWGWRHFRCLRAIIMDMKYYRQAHAVYHTEYHLVWIPRYRRKILIPAIAKYIDIQLHRVSKRYPDLLFLERNIQPDHIHLLISIPPRMSVSDVVRVLKLTTGADIKKKFKFLNKLYPCKEGIWSAGYFVSTVGINEKTIRRYIKSQTHEDSGQAKLEL